jgi:hypothetical protein
VNLRRAVSIMVLSAGIMAMGAFSIPMGFALLMYLADTDTKNYHAKSVVKVEKSKEYTV